MGPKISIKWKLVLGIVAAAVPVWILLAVLLQSAVREIDQLELEEVKQRAELTAITLESGIVESLARKGENAEGAALETLIMKDDSSPEETGEAGMEGGGETDTNGLDETHAETRMGRSLYLLDEDGNTLAQAGDKLNIANLPLDNNERLFLTKWGDYHVAVRKLITRVNQGEKLVYLQESRSFSRSILTMVHSLIALGIMLIGAVAYRHGRQAAEPVVTLAQTSKQIAAGDFVGVQNIDTAFAETNELASSFQGMTSALSHQLSSLKDLTQTLSRNSAGFSDSMRLLTLSASEQAAAVTETAATVEEMEQAGKSAAGNAKLIVDAADKTTETSIRGRQAVQTTNEIIIKIKKDSQDIVDKSRHLLTAVEEVGNIIRSVNAIAEQSKILAVNASIEAAKAGEYGSGFAVVAQEVKDLAQQSKDATLQITGTLTAIRQAIETMVETSHSGEARTGEGVTTIANAGAIMNDLSEAIRESSDFANVIATNINQQTVGLTQIATSIEQINTTAFENQNISRRNSDMANQMLATIEQLNNMMDNWQTPEVGHPEGSDPEDSANEEENVA